MRDLYELIRGLIRPPKPYKAPKGLLRALKARRETKKKVLQGSVRALGLQGP